MEYALGPADFLNDNSISQIAFGFFMAILACLGLALKWVHRTLTTAVQAKNEAATAAKRAEPISNGFAGKVHSKLDNLTDLATQNNHAIDQVQLQLTDHLKWHLERETQNG